MTMLLAPPSKNRVEEIIKEEPEVHEIPVRRTRRWGLFRRTANVEKLRAAVEWVERTAQHNRYLGYPQWRQDVTWLSPYAYAPIRSCQACVAGFTVWQAGQLSEEWTCNKAQKILGLTKWQAGWLFASNNDAARIRRLAEKYAGQKL